MRVDWLPVAATSLVAGATALAFGALLVPGGSESLEALRVSVGEDSRWLAVALLYFFAALALTLGLPALLTLLDARTVRAGLLGAGIFAVGCLGTAGYAMLLVFLRALVRADLLRDQGLNGLERDPGFNAFIIIWIGAFYVGEALIALTLLRARSVPRWVPTLLLLHVAVFPLRGVLPVEVNELTVLLVTIGFAGIGIGANTRHQVAQYA